MKYNIIICQQCWSWGMLKIYTDSLKSESVMQGAVDYIQVKKRKEKRKHHFYID